MKDSIQKLETDTELMDVSELAREIWTEHYTPLIGPAQTEYMILNFQSAGRIKKDISEKGYSYFAVYDEKKPVGYFALRPDEKGVFISKLYVLKEYRQRGIAKKMIQFSLDFAKEAIHSEKKKFNAASHEKPCMWLTVNKGNLGSIEFYKKVGFEISEEIVTDIGNGFVMDDYVMTLFFDAD